MTTKAEKAAQIELSTVALHHLCPKGTRIYVAIQQPATLRYHRLYVIHTDNDGMPPRLIEITAHVGELLEKYFTYSTKGGAKFGIVTDSDALDAMIATLSEKLYPDTTEHTASGARRVALKYERLF